ncbi:hypothetical protein H2248_008739 [Termitomyces sp. 'cryptogamus']|nr:hypothetical protein H2248_008739 [Termitomyces sp. 'cryptogamus']
MQQQHRKHKPYRAHRPNQDCTSFQNTDEDIDDMPTLSTYFSSFRLPALITSAPADKLPENLNRLVDRNPGFQLAIAQGLLSTPFATPEAPPVCKA